MHRSRALLLLLSIAGSAAARAGADLVLQDGTVLSGTSVERSPEGVYILELEDGDSIVVPVELVKRIALTGGEEPAPSGLRVAGPQILAGPPEPIEAPRTRDQLAAFGRDPATFRVGSADARWQPRSGLGEDVTEFNPTRWFRAPTDPTWTPKSVYKASGDVTEFNPARWFRSPTDPIWRPKSGFRPSTEWFPRARSRESELP